MRIVALATVAVLAGLMAVSASAPPQPAVSTIGMTKVGQQYAATQPADNSRCFVCHKNYQKERLVAGHAKAGVSCEKCHGPNDAHCQDEEHLTPPDIMYPRPKIVPACGECHDLNKARQKHIWWGHRIDTTGQKQVCTDCHGYHRLERRTSRWDKETRDIIPVIPALDNAKPTPATGPAKPAATAAFNCQFPIANCQLKKAFNSQFPIVNCQGKRAKQIAFNWQWAMGNWQFPTGATT